MSAMTATITRDQNRLDSGAYSTTTTLYDGDGDGGRERIGVAAGAEQIIFGMLSDLSMNRGAYVLREAYSNAYDATKATGSMDGEIDIVIPAIASAGTNGGSGITAKLIGSDAVQCGRHAIVRVSDNGIGMTERDVRRYFLQYGGSKKRDDVDAIGSKGLGAKAPLSVSDVFEVRSRKGGIETTASIARDGGSCYASVSTRRTDRHDGTDVLIPVNDPDVLRQMRACADMLANSNIDANLVINGVRAQRIVDGDNPVMTHVGRIAVGTDGNGNAIESDVLWCKGTVTAGSRSFRRYPSTSVSNVNVIVGGYPYSLTNAVRGNGAGTAGFDKPGWYVTCDPGYLNFTPSRDAIKSDAHARALLDGINAAIRDMDMSDFACRVIDGATLAERLALLDGSALCTHFLTWDYADDGTLRGFETNEAFGAWNAYIPARHLMYDGINLASITRHNANRTGQGAHMCIGRHDLRGMRAQLGDADSLVITHVYTRGASWYVNGDRSFPYQSDASDALSGTSAMDCLTGHWTDLLDVAEFGSYTSKRYALILTGYDDEGRSGSSVLRLMTGMLRAAFPSFGRDGSGNKAGLMLTSKGADGIDGTMLAIVKAMYGNVAVMSWSDACESVKAYRKAHRATRGTRTFGRSVAYVADVSDVSDVSDCIAKAELRRLGSMQLSDFDGQDDDGFDDVAFAIVPNSSYCDSAMFGICVMLLNGAFDGKVKRACILEKPYVSDVTALVKRGCRIAFDMRTAAKPIDGAVLSRGGERRFGVGLDSDCYNLLIDGNLLYGSDRSVMTYLALKYYGVSPDVMRYVGYGALDGTRLEGVLDADYERHIDKWRIDSVNRLYHVSVDAPITSKCYRAMSVINDALDHGPLHSMRYGVSFDTCDCGKEYDGIVDALRRSLIDALRESIAIELGKRGTDPLGEDRCEDDGLGVLLAKLDPLAEER